MLPGYCRVTLTVDASRAVVVHLASPEGVPEDVWILLEHVVDAPDDHTHSVHRQGSLQLDKERHQNSRVSNCYHLLRPLANVTLYLEYVGTHRHLQFLQFIEVINQDVIPLKVAESCGCQ